MKILTLSIRLPEDITFWLDSLIHSGLYKSRSEAVRDFARDFLSAEAKETSVLGANRLTQGQGFQRTNLGR